METEYGQEELRVIALENAVELMRGCSPYDYMTTVHAARAFHAFLEGDAEATAEPDSSEPEGEAHEPVSEAA